MRAVVTVLLALLAGTAHAVPGAMPEPDHLEQALSAYQSRDYPRAAAEFELAYAATPTTDILFGWAQAERLAGNCPAAIPHYRELLQHTLPPPQATAAQQSLARCEAAVAAAPAPPEPAPSPPPDPAANANMNANVNANVNVPATTPAADAAPRKAWYKDVPGGLLTGGGVVLLGTSLALYVSAQSLHADASDTTNYSDFQSLHDRADSRETTAAICAFTGAALITGGVVRYVLVRRRARRTVLTATPTAQGAALVLAGEF